MKYDEARSQFIQTWSQLSQHWGISKPMARIHAVLILSPTPMTADDLMRELDISRGNVSTSLRLLMEWGIVHKAYIPGERKDHFTAEKDIWKMALSIARERKRRELDPVITTLQQLQVTEPDPGLLREVEEFNTISSQLLDVAMQIDKVMEAGIRSGSQSLARK